MPAANLSACPTQNGQGAAGSTTSIVATVASSCHGAPIDATTVVSNGTTNNTDFLYKQPCVGQTPPAAVVPCCASQIQQYDCAQQQPDNHSPTCGQLFPHSNGHGRHFYDDTSLTAAANATGISVPVPSSKNGFIVFSADEMQLPTDEPPTSQHQIPQQMRLYYYLTRYAERQVMARKQKIKRTIEECIHLIQEILKEVESLEPRFISSLAEVHGRYEGLYALSENELEVILFLNQMGVFNFVDDGQVPGCAVLKLSDGRKRSMSLWVEFITASGYLSARKIRSRFHTLITQAVEKSRHSDQIAVLPDNGDVRLRIKDTYTIQITPAFRCAGIWPRSAAHWPLPHNPWPSPSLIAEVKTEGFDLLSKESIYVREKQSNVEGDSWVMNFGESKRRLLKGGCRARCYSILKSLQETVLSSTPGNPIGNRHLLAIVLYELEKHPREHEWDDMAIGDRINGILLQLISCLQNRRCPDYFLPQVDLFRGNSQQSMDAAAKRVWELLRSLIINPKCLETF